MAVETSISKGAILVMQDASDKGKILICRVVKAEMKSFLEGKIFFVAQLWLVIFKINFAVIFVRKTHKSFVKS